MGIVLIRWRGKDNTMAIKYICDRCHKETDNDSDIFRLLLQVTKLTYKIQYTPHTAISIQLNPVEWCKDCLENTISQKVPEGQEQAPPTLEDIIKDMVHETMEDNMQ